jgi:hypothetical protein
MKNVPILAFWRTLDGSLGPAVPGLAERMG